MLCMDTMVVATPSHRTLKSDLDTHSISRNVLCFGLFGMMKKENDVLQISAHGAESHSNPRSLVGQRVRLAGYGDGVVKGFRKLQFPLMAGLKGSPHIIAFDDGREIDLVLQRLKLGSDNGGVPYTVLDVQSPVPRASTLTLDELKERQELAEAEAAKQRVRFKHLNSASSNVEAAAGVVTGAAGVIGSTGMRSFGSACICF